MSSKSLSNTTPTALIVEDESELRVEIADLLHSLWPELKIVGQAQDGIEALMQIENRQPDIVFLDIQIPDPNGLEVAREIADRCHIVFITAYDAHAVEAFENDAVDYILKPIDTDRLSLTVQRLKKRILHSPTNMSELVSRFQPRPSRSQYTKWIASTVGNAFRLIMTDQVVFFQADNRYTRIALEKSEVLITKTLKELLEELDPEQFWQVHRSTIVNAAEIASIEPDMAGRLGIRLKGRRECLPVSDSFMRKFRQM
jgi:DNA-binding LytR/AlgR family response regulator